MEQYEDRIQEWRKAASDEALKIVYLDKETDRVCVITSEMLVKLAKFLEDILDNTSLVYTES